MGINIDGARDLLTATDGSLTIEGQSVNTTGIITASGGMKVGSAATIHSTGQFNIGVAATIFANGNATFSGITTFGGNINANGNIVGDNSTDISGINDVTISMLSISDTITHTGDTDTKIRFPSADTITAETGGSERLRIRADGRVSIASSLNVTGVCTSGSFQTSGRVLLGTTTNTSPIGWGNNLQVAATSAAAGVSIRRDSADTGGALLVFGKSRGSLNGNTVVQSGDQIGGMYFAGGDGTDVNSIAAQLSVEVDGTPGSNDMPGRMVFKTTADGAANPTERLRIDKTGAWGIAGANYGTSGQFLKSGGSGAAVSWGDASGGIDVAHQWRVTSDASGNQSPITSWELVDTYGGGGYGSAMSESSGVFTFPSTGWWLIIFQLHGASDNHSQNVIARIDTTINSGSNYYHTSRAANGIYDFNNSYPSHASVTIQALFDVTSTSTHKVRFTFGAGQGGEYLKGSGDYTYTGATFIRLGDT